VTGTYAIKALKNGTGFPVSATKPKDDFKNSNPGDCPVSTYTIVNKDNTPYTGNAVLIGISGSITIDEARYDGTTLDLKIKAVTEFGTPVYKTLTVSEKCGENTLSKKDA